MSFRMTIDPRASKAGRFIRRVHSEIQRVFAKSGLTQQQLAVKLGVNRATVNKRLLGEENLTLRSIADMAWALDADIVFDLREHEGERGNREPRLTKAETNVAPLPIITNVTVPFASTSVPVEQGILLSHG